jgi:hypothetical protein
MKRTIKFPKAKIDEIFLSATHENNALVSLYRAVIPEFDKVNKIFGFPTVSRNTAIYIIDKLKGLSENDGSTSNILWLNKGFNSDDKMKDWIVDLTSLRCEI